MFLNFGVKVMSRGSLANPSAVKPTSLNVTNWSTERPVTVGCIQRPAASHSDCHHAGADACRVRAQATNWMTQSLDDTPAHTSDTRPHEYASTQMSRRVRETDDNVQQT